MGRGRRSAGLLDPRSRGRLRVGLRSRQGGCLRVFCASFSCLRGFAPTTHKSVMIELNTCNLYMGAALSKSTGRMILITHAFTYMNLILIHALVNEHRAHDVDKTCLLMSVAMWQKASWIFHFGVGSVCVCV